MSDVDIFSSPEKFPSLFYFFPLVSAGYIYWTETTLFNLIAFITTSVAVILMQSYHLAYKSLSTPQDNSWLLETMIDFAVNKKKFINRFLCFLCFDGAWFFSYLLTLFMLWQRRSEKIFLILFFIQVGLGLFSLLTLYFLALVYKEKKSESQLNQPLIQKGVPKG